MPDCRTACPGHAGTGRAGRSAEHIFGGRLRAAATGARLPTGPDAATDGRPVAGVTRAGTARAMPAVSLVAPTAECGHAVALKAVAAVSGTTVNAGCILAS